METNKFSQNWNLLRSTLSEIVSAIKLKFFGTSEGRNEYSEFDEYGHVFRKKTRFELVQISAAVMGIEFSYAAETAFVSPTLLSIGVKHQQMTLVWALSPMIGFFLTPVLGSISDRCRLKLGRRRPFIMLLSTGIFIGLLLVPNGEAIGYLLGDTDLPQGETNLSSAASHQWGIFFTIIGTVLLDFDADACQSPSRAYLLDVTVPEQHAKGLSTFTIMAGLGGFMGYSLGGINWEELSLGIWLGGHVHAVFTIVTIIFIVCIAVTMNSFKEIPLEMIDLLSKTDLNDGDEYRAPTEDFISMHDQPTNDNANASRSAVQETSFTENANHGKSSPPIDDSKSVPTLREYLESIVFMPTSLRLVCTTNLLCWMAHVCYSLYFTDFVGESIFGGDPRAPENSTEYILYCDGVRFGCWGMAMYSLSCACYSMIIEQFIRQYGAKKTYVGGLLFNSIGMTIMALTRARISVIVFSATAGVMYSTLFTMPYLLVAHYHSNGTFDSNGANENGPGNSPIRGLGTDVAIVSSMVFLAQLILSACMGTIIKWSGTTASVVATASFLSFCGAISATKIMYLNL